MRMGSIYSDVILDHFRNPRNYGRIDLPDAAHEDLNPLCGDRIRMELKMKRGEVEIVRFTGNGCAITMASASILTEQVKGVDIRNRDAISQSELLTLLKASIKESRMRCVTLPLDVLNRAIEIWRSK